MIPLAKPHMSSQINDLNKSKKELEDIIEKRSLYAWREGMSKIAITLDGGSHFVSCAMPIISEGDVVGCVASLCADGAKPHENIGAEIESKLILTAAGFLGKQLEN